MDITYYDDKSMTILLEVYMKREKIKYYDILEIDDIEFLKNEDENGKILCLYRNNEIVDRLFFTDYFCENLFVCYSNEYLIFVTYFKMLVYKIKNNDIINIISIIELEFNI